MFKSVPVYEIRGYKKGEMSASVVEYSIQKPKKRALESFRRENGCAFYECEKTVKTCKIEVVEG